MKFTIKNREINNFLKPYIIAETCINHEGNLETAEKMIISAKEAGADCVKFQIHILKNKKLIKKLKKCRNPYGNGDSSKKIVHILKNIKINKKLLDKENTY